MCPAPRTFMSGAQLCVLRCASVWRSVGRDFGIAGTHSAPDQAQRVRFQYWEYRNRAQREREWSDENCAPAPAIWAPRLFTGAPHRNPWRPDPPRPARTARLLQRSGRHACSPEHLTEILGAQIRHDPRERRTERRSVSVVSLRTGRRSAKVGSGGASRVAGPARHPLCCSPEFCVPRSTHQLPR